MTLEHAAAVQRLVAHPEVAATSLVPHPYPADGAVRFITEEVLPGRADGTSYTFAIMAEGEPELVGAIQLKHVDRERGEAELGYWIGRPYWGRGYASAAAALAVRFGFEGIGLRRIYAHVLAHNPASARVLEKVGFAPVALPPEAVPCGCASKGQTLGFELLRPAWARREAP